MLRKPKVLSPSNANLPTAAPLAQPAVSRVMLYPSGGAWVTMLAAMPPPPPVLFSTVMVWPSRSAILSASSRPMMSGLPPGEVPTRMRSGRCGQFCWARAGSAELAGESGGERERAAAGKDHGVSRLETTRR